MISPKWNCIIQMVVIMLATVAQHMFFVECWAKCCRQLYEQLHIRRKPYNFKTRRLHSKTMKHWNIQKENYSSASATQSKNNDTLLKTIISEQQFPFSMFSRLSVNRARESVAQKKSNRISLSTETDVVHFGAH